MRFRWSSLAMALAAALTMVVGVGSGPAEAAADPTIVTALDTDTTVVVDTVVRADPAAIAVATTPIGGFPTKDSYLVLSTGLAANLPGSPGTFISTNLTGAPAGADGNDLTQVSLQLRPPATARCVAFDFAFLSEEYPEYVGSRFNDIFTAELNESLFTVTGDQVVAPNNFAYDSQGNTVSINTVFGLSEVPGTNMDGTTPVLTAISPIELGPDGTTISVILSVQDLGDSIYDSAVLIDNLRWLFGSGCTGGATNQTDTDGDSLPDVWETDGVDYDEDGVPEVDLPAMGADPRHKDLFVEVDWMERPPTCIWFICWGGRSFAPNQAALADVRAAFAAAPVANPDGTSGIRIHIDSGAGAIMDPVSGATWGGRSRANNVGHVQSLGTSSGGQYDWSAFDGLKSANFEVFRRDVFHYVLYADTYAGSGSSGISRGIPGGDVLATDGDASWGGGFTRTQERGTFMHELGHNLGLQHGGGDGVNRKPNYLSIMSYRFQLVGLLPGVGLDYSPADLSDLAESALSETAGLDPDGSVGGRGTSWACGGSAADARSNLDWNCNGTVQTATVSSDINGDGSTTVLTGFDDWAAIRYDGGGIGDLGQSADDSPLTTEAAELDPATARDDGAFARPGDGTVTFAGPSVLLPNTGPRNLAFDVTNASTVPASFTITLSGLPVVLPAPVRIDAGATTRVNVVVDSDALAPGTFTGEATIASDVGGPALATVPVSVVVPDLSDPATAAAAADAFNQLAGLPGGTGPDPAVTQELLDMAGVGTNQPPTVSDASAEVVAGASVAVTVTGSDPDADPLTWRVATDPAHGSVQGSGPTFTYTPAPGFTGTDSFTVVANDGTVDSVPATVRLTVVAAPEQDWTATLKLQGTTRFRGSFASTEPVVVSDKRGVVSVTAEAPTGSGFKLSLLRGRLGPLLSGTLAYTGPTGSRTISVWGVWTPKGYTLIGAWSAPRELGVLTLSFAPPK